MVQERRLKTIKKIATWVCNQSLVRRTHQKIWTIKGVDFLKLLVLEVNDHDHPTRIRGWSEQNFLMAAFNSVPPLCYGEY